jgi:hypothetical protein
MIEYVTINQTPKNGVIQYELSKNYGYIGLVQICLYGLNFIPSYYNVVKVVVEELDKTSDNPNRLIATCLFNQRKTYFNEKEYTNIQWQKFDSAGKQLNIKFYDEHGELYKFKDHTFNEKTTYNQIQITLALLPKNTKWIDRV